MAFERLAGQVEQETASEPVSDYLSGDDMQQSNEYLIVRKIFWRVIPLLMVLYVVSYINRINVEITSSLAYGQLMAGDVKRRVSADPVDRLAPVRHP
jgi:hypothetical protein